MTALDWATTTTHTDVVCPPDPTALCAHCSRTLAQHATTDLDIPNPSTAVCLNREHFNEYKAIRWLPFELAAGQSLDCVHASFCEQCHVAICPEHSTAFTTCTDQAYTYHHLDCANDCDDCMEQVAADSAEDYAIEQWKGVA